MSRSSFCCLHLSFRKWLTLKICQLLEENSNNDWRSSRRPTILHLESQPAVYEAGHNFFSSGILFSHLSAWGPYTVVSAMLGSFEKKFFIFSIINIYLTWRFSCATYPWPAAERPPDLVMEIDGKLKAETWDDPLTGPQGGLKLPCPRGPPGATVKMGFRGQYSRIFRHQGFFV